VCPQNLLRPPSAQVKSDVRRRDIMRTYPHAWVIRIFRIWARARRAHEVCVYPRYHTLEPGSTPGNARISRFPSDTRDVYIGSHTQLVLVWWPHCARSGMKNKQMARRVCNAPHEHAFTPQQPTTAPQSCIFLRSATAFLRREDGVLGPAFFLASPQPGGWVVFPSFFPCPCPHAFCDAYIRHPSQHVNVQAYISAHLGAQYRNVCWAGSTVLSAPKPRGE
jgi:hypothetical protein